MSASFTIMLADLIRDGWSAPLAYYPVFDESYRPLLNDKILRHYMMWEIGMETVELFEYQLQTKMGEIMPFYNQLYESERKVYDPFKTMLYNDVMTGSLDITGHSGEDTTSEAVTTSNNTADSLSRAVASDTPQTRLSGDEDYASGMSDNSSHGTSTAASDAHTTANQTADHTNNQAQNTNRSIDGYSGVSPSKLLRDYRSQMLNIDMMVITDLAPCFMSIYDAGDSMTDYTAPGAISGLGGMFTPGQPYPYYF